MPQNTTRNERRVLGGAVFRIRKIQDLTQAQIATKAGVDDAGKPFFDHTLISHVEKNRRSLSLAQMCALASALGADLDEISYFANVYVVAPAEQVTA